MNNKFKNYIDNIYKDKIVYLSVGTILLVAAFLRVYNVDRILGFYFDQGRDALVIRDFIVNHKISLLGPTTGIAGIFRGPWYYWLITPLYFFGNGNPVWPAVFLGLSTVVAIAILYYLTVALSNRTTGIIAVLLASFSYQLVVSSRWLSNPTPMFLFSMLLILGMFKIVDGKKWGWVLVSLSSGMSLFNFGSSTELFYFPAIFIFLLIQIKRHGLKKIIPSKNIIIASVFMFVISFLPLIIFDLRHGGILLGDTKSFILEGETFSFPSWRFIFDKITFYYEVFSSKIFIGVYEKEKILLGALFFVFSLNFTKLFVSEKFRIVLLVFISPLVGLIFFKGNFGNIYDYYLTGYYLIFILLAATAMGSVWDSVTGKLFVAYFLWAFFNSNIPALKYYLNNEGLGSETIVFSSQKKAIEWIANDSKNIDYNVDVYVPPVISYSYDYLFEWYGGDVLKNPPKDYRTDVVYTLYEVDPPHPERLKAWIDRQNGIGKVTSEERFGGITVQKRIRIL